MDLHFSFDVSRAAALSYAFYGKQVPALLCCKELSLAEGPRGSRCDVLGRTLKNDHRHYVFPPGADSVPGFVLPLKGIWCFFQIPFFLSNFFFFFFWRRLGILPVTEQNDKNVHRWTSKIENKCKLPWIHSFFMLNRSANLARHFETEKWLGFSFFTTERTNKLPPCSL